MNDKYNDHDRAILMACEKFEEVHPHADQPSWLKYCMSLNVVKNKNEWNSTKLEFKHRTNKEITGLSYMTSLVIQALKTLGRSNVTPEVIQMPSEKLTDKDKQACLKEATESTDWVYDTADLWR